MPSFSDLIPNLILLFAVFYSSMFKTFDFKKSLSKTLNDFFKFKLPKLSDLYTKQNYWHKTLQTILKLIVRSIPSVLLRSG